MMSMRQRTGSRLAALACAAAMVLATAAPAAPVEDFSFLQISDIHIGPRPAGMKLGEDDRSVPTIRWLCQEASKPQPQTPYQIVAPPPAFVLGTGDISEFGFIGDTWPFVERLFQPLPCPLYLVPGNHDNTWTAMLALMRKKHGGDSYSFDKFGCHFVGLNTASPQEPLPCLDRRTLAWLAQDLKKVKPPTPIFIFLHHPLTGQGEFAYPYEQLRLLDVLEGHNVVLILDGHGHGVNHGLWENIDRVMGGSTFGDNAGYSVISVLKGTLRVAYRFHGDKPMKSLLEKPLFSAKPRVELEIVAPTAARPLDASKPIAVSARIASDVAVTKVMASLDGDDAKAIALKPNGRQCTGRFPAAPRLAGRHFVCLTATLADKREIRRAAEFELASAGAAIAAKRYQHTAGFKAAPLPHKGLIVAGDTAGTLTAFDRSLNVKWTCRTGGEILATPTAAGDRILFGSGDGLVRAVVAATGKPAWEYAAKAPVYSQIVIQDGVAYFGDNEGFVHAVRVADGKPVWTAKPASFSIESGGALLGDTFCVGAWDGYVYGLSVKDGATRWKQPSPTGQVQKPNRYYAAADCPPIALGGRLFIADRGYRLGCYGADGAFDRVIREECTGVGLSEDGSFAYARTRLDRLVKCDRDGKILWEKELPLGRFPIAPTERAGKVYACSNRGLLSAVDAANGDVLWQYQVTPQLHVMAGVAVDDDGVAYVADMDGVLTAVGPGAATQSR